MCDESLLSWNLAVLPHVSATSIPPALLWMQPISLSFPFILVVVSVPGAPRLPQVGRLLREAEVRCKEAGSLVSTASLDHEKPLSPSFPSPLPSAGTFDSSETEANRQAAPQHWAAPGDPPP